MEFQIDVTGPLSGLRELEKFPKAGLKRVMRQAANIIKNEVKDYAPYETGELQSAIIIKEERQKPYKSSFRVTLKPYQSFVKDDNGIRYYYPASQEYGWKMKNGQKHPGRHYFENAAEDTSEQTHQLIINEFDKVIASVKMGTLSATGARIRG